MKTQQTKYPRSSKAWSSSTLLMARFNPLRARREQNRKQRSGFPSGLVRERSVRVPEASCVCQGTASSHPGSSVAAREICGNGKRCLGDRTARMLILLRSRGKCLDAVSMYSLLATHGVARRKPMSANRQGREHLQKKPPTTRERRAHQTVRWLTPYRSASEPDNFSRFISYL